jgi:hypothetical protein
MELDEIMGRGKGVVTLAHVQATMYLSTYETRMSWFPRSWLSVGRAVRLCHMMNFHRIDGADFESREVHPANASDWVEVEEKRRVFWSIFMHDRYQAIGSGWPTLIDERDVGSAISSDIAR